ncbi:MAG TPA: bifunctional diaminohydroxyphosphoribosylaminopyrimidine deaminase/5-amino-6-(5-phosphoribosylamino)uracil reductase RibD [Paludibacter sp.]|nr:bifunctional diaminohydroxyphosphoribosylaminopyrimidine deaminase/5-amino-6-(5-phosphoribosylamino)uracil reductase RibD [Paludibacter sp.]
MNYEEKYIYRCLQLAAFGGGHVAPNPMVGAVIVHNHRIIGEGFHHRYGEAHAEPNAILSVKDEALLQKSTLYVNLEPCSHVGKTQPCARLIVDKKIPKVVVGTLDPNPKVSGRGIKILQDAGIKVVTNVLEDECRRLNKRFFALHNEHRPFILLKWAETRDGFIDVIRHDAGTPPLQISGQLAKQLTHKMRSENQAIMVSTNTAVLDNPSLITKHWPGKNPIRIILDRTGRIPEHYSVFNDLAETLIFTENPRKNTESTKYIYLHFDECMLNNLLQTLASRNIHSVLVEGGAQLLKNFIDAGLWDEALVEVSGQIIGQGVQAPSTGIVPDSYVIINNHLHLKYINRNKKFNTHSSV